MSFYLHILHSEDCLLSIECHMIVYKSRQSPVKHDSDLEYRPPERQNFGKGVSGVRTSISVKRIEVMLRLWVKRLDRGAKNNPSPQSSLLSTFHSFAEFSLWLSGACRNLTAQDRLFYKYYSPSQTLFFIVLTRVLSSLNVFSLVISPAVDAIVSNSSMLTSSPIPTTTIVTLFLFNAMDDRATARMFSDFPLVNTMRTFGTSGREPPFAEKRFTRANCNASSCFVLPPSAKTMLSTISFKRKILLSALNCKSNMTLAIAEDRINPTRVPFAEMWKFSITDHTKRLTSWNSLSLTDEESSMKARSAFPEQTKQKYTVP